MNDQSIGQHYLDDALHTFRDYKKLAEGAFAQISDEEFFRTIDDESNSIAVNVKHMAGNMLSRWTDFLTTDGEKPERNRDLEFVMLPETTRQEMVAYWERGWRCVYDAIEPLTPDDLMRPITIRGQAHTVVQAINRQLSHYAYHVGQMVYLAKHFKSSDWKSLSVPKNQSAEFNAKIFRRPRISNPNASGLPDSQASDTLPGPDTRQPPPGYRSSGGNMFLGLRTAIYHVDDIEKGKAWYGSVLGKAPYFDQPFYVGFNVGGYELGLQPTEVPQAARADGAVSYWGVENATAEFERLIGIGATAHEPVQDVGEGIKVATVKDPFGNVFGIIENPNFKVE